MQAADSDAATARILSQKRRKNPHGNFTEQLSHSARTTCGILDFRYRAGVARARIRTRDPDVRSGARPGDTRRLAASLAGPISIKFL